MCSIKQLKDTSEELPIGVLITDLNGVIEYANKTLCGINGYCKEDLIGNKPSVLKSGEHNEFFYKELWDTITKGEVFKGEIKNKKKDGSTYWQTVVIKPFKKTHFVAYIDDITQKRFEGLLLKSMIETSYDNHIIWDNERKAIKSYPSMNGSINEFYVKIIGNRLEDLDCNVCNLTKEQIEEHNRFFDVIDKENRADNKIVVGGIFRIKNNDTVKVLQVLMQRFNSNKYYEIIRDVTDFYKDENDALSNLAEVIENRRQLNYNIRESLYGRQARSFLDENS